MLEEKKYLKVEWVVYFTEGVSQQCGYIYFSFIDLAAIYAKDLFSNWTLAYPTSVEVFHGDPMVLSPDVEVNNFKPEMLG